MATVSLEVIVMWKDILKIDMKEANFLGDKYAPQDMAEAKERMKRERLNRSAPKRVAWINRNKKWLNENSSKFSDDARETLERTLQEASQNAENFSHYRLSFNSFIAALGLKKPKNMA